MLTARIRDQVRGDNVLVKAKDALTRLVIGTGVAAYSDASCMEEDNEDLVSFEIESDTWFSRWATDEFDAEGEFGMYEQQRTAFGDEVEAGNVLWLKVMDPNPTRIVPLCYQLLEWEQIDTDRDRDVTVSRTKRGQIYNRISNGIEYDERNRKVAFYVFDAHPYDSSTGWTPASTRIPADRIIHQYTPTRPSAKLGVTWFAAPLRTAHDLDRFVANELTTRALTALMGVAVFSSDRNAKVCLDAEDDETGVPNFQLGYPYVGALKAEDRVEIIESKHSTGDSETFRNLLMTLAAMGCKISVSTLLGDPSKSNMASIKAAHHEDDETVAPIQTCFANRVVIPMRREFTAQAIALGRLRSVRAQDYTRRPWKYNQCALIASNRADLDKDDGEASLDRLRSGLATYQDECARRGKHWRHNLRKMQVVNEEAKRLGIVLDWSKGQGNAPMQATSVAQGAIATDE
jgi:lambda family phage portal protein